MSWSLETKTISKLLSPASFIDLYVSASTGVKPTTGTGGRSEETKIKIYIKNEILNCGKNINPKVSY